MAITKFSESEHIEAARQEERKKIITFVKQAGKTSVEELTEGEKEDLQKSLTN